MLWGGCWPLSFLYSIQCTSYKSHTLRKTTSAVETRAARPNQLCSSTYMHLILLIFKSINNSSGAWIFGGVLGRSRPRVSSRVHPTSPPRSRRQAVPSTYRETGLYIRPNTHFLRRSTLSKTNKISGDECFWGGLLAAVVFVFHSVYILQVPYAPEDNQCRPLVAKPGCI